MRGKSRLSMARNGAADGKSKRSRLPLPNFLSLHTPLPHMFRMPQLNYVNNINTKDLHLRRFVHF